MNICTVKYQWWIFFFLHLLKKHTSMPCFQDQSSAEYQNCSNVIMQVTRSVIVMYVTVSSNNLLSLSLTASFHKIDQKTFKGIIWDFHFTTFVNILLRLRYFEDRNYIHILVTRVTQYFCFPDRPMKSGDILDF